MGLGYYGVYVEKAYVLGEAPDVLRTAVGQRSRWCKVLPPSTARLCLQQESGLLLEEGSRHAEPSRQRAAPLSARRAASKWQLCGFPATMHIASMVQRDFM